MSRKCLLDCSANGAKWADDVHRWINSRSESSRLKNRSLVPRTTSDDTSFFVELYCSTDAMMRVKGSLPHNLARTSDTSLLHLRALSLFPELPGYPGN